MNEIKGIGLFIGIMIGVQLIGLVSVSIYINKSINEVISKEDRLKSSILLLPHKVINFLFKGIDRFMNLEI